MGNLLRYDILTLDILPLSGRVYMKCYITVVTSCGDVALVGTNCDVATTAQ